MAWPYWASLEDLTGFPQTVISVNECDPLRDEGVAFYRKLIEAGVNARCRNVLGTMHATELVPIICPEITADAASHLATFAMNP
jgi:acetyl esterase/lipase